MRLRLLAPALALVLLPFAWKAVADDAKPADLPAAVRERVEKEAPGARVKGVEIQEKNGRRVYEVTVVRDGKSEELAIAADGMLLGRDADDEDDDEAPVAESAVPAVVRAGVAKVLGGTPVKAWTKETQDGVDVYEAEYAVDGGKGSVSFSGEGEFLEREEHVAVVPAAVLKRIGTLHPGASVVSSEVVRRRYFEMKIKVGAETHELVVDAAGTVLGERSGADEDDEKDEKPTKAEKPETK